MDTTQPPPPPHRTTTTTATDLFTCFTSRHHHTTKMSPSIPSPTSLTASLSRRLKTNRSIKGSPALFSTSKKRFDNPEPSSPKVTCIGQVKIKSRKKVKRNKRVFVKSSSFSSSTNESQKWVHLPLTICEGLRSFGSEFSCLFPCFSPPEKEYSGDRRTSGSCAAVCTRWLVVDDCGRSGGRRRDIELVASEEEEDDVSIRVSSRRHVFDDLKIVNNNIVEGNDQCSSSRLSICVPPKNALLLMRCRSDPLKMEALANRLWDSTISQNDDSDQDNDELVQNEFEYVHEIQEMQEIQEMEHNIEELYQEEKNYKEQILETNNEKDDECTFFGSLFDENVYQVHNLEEILVQDQGFEEDVDQDLVESNMEKVKLNGFEGKNEEEMYQESNERGNLPECLLLMMCEPKLSMEVSKETWVSSKDFFRRNSSRKKPPPAPVPAKPTGGQDESKVSAASTTKANFQNGINFDNLTAAQSRIQPGRSSCSLPVAPSMAEMLEHKLVNAVGYEPFVLTRCKSEPMRTAAGKLAQDSCFWKNRKLEPLRRASFGVKLGAAGVGC
ncbi:hypothetical protein Tco_0116957 [Tanacetum coccineum]